MKTGFVNPFFLACLQLILIGIVNTSSGGEGGGKGKVEYVRLPLLTFVEPQSSILTTPRSYQTTTLSVSSSSALIDSPVKFVGDDGGRAEEKEGIGNWTGLDGLRSVSQVISQLTHLVTGDDDGDNGDDGESMEEQTIAEDGGMQQEGREQGEHSNNGGIVMEDTEGRVDAEGNDNEEEEGVEDNFNEFDLIELVQELERQADEEEQTGIFPEILDILHGKMHKGNSSNSNQQDAMVTTTPATTMTDSPLEEWPESGHENNSENKNLTSGRNGSSRLSLNEDGDLQLGSEDLSEFSDEIVEGISAGVEESLRMSDDLEIDDFGFASGDNETAEMRQFSVYLFQGQYYAEPRLNRFIDGALRNMGTELRVASMDPLYFRVLPRGRVAEREQPLMPASGSGIRRRRPAGGGGGGGVATGRQLKLPAFFRPNANNQKKVQQKLRQQSLNRPGKRQKVTTGQQVTRIASLGGKNIFLRRKRQQQRLLRQRRRRQRIRQQKIRQQQKNKRKKQQQQQAQKNNQNKQSQLLQRIRRRIKQDVGGGRIEGLSRVQRDGDAEMQLFGNYTLIRSHMKLGPVEITMQFRTKNGIRRTGASLPAIRAHTVTRVNHEGSEMIDYLLDRPTPEMIRVRGTLFPLAQRIARNIFARLFLPNSFLVSKLREKAALAYLSKPAARRRRKR